MSTPSGIDDALAGEPKEAPGGASAEKLTATQIRAGMAIMQTVYAVAMTLGFRVVVENSYKLLFDHASIRHSPPAIVVWLAAFAVVSLGVRFFWVPRNLYSYLLSDHGRGHDEVSRNIVMFHFPIAFFHAILFSFACAAWVEVATHRMSTTLALNFAGLFSALLLMNALWLWRITPKGTRDDESRPGVVWRNNNLAFGLVMLALCVFADRYRLSPGILLPVVSSLLLINSVIDFRFAATGYLMLPGT